MSCIRIERAQNGYSVSATDPAIQKWNDAHPGKWKDCTREYVFDGEDALKDALEFIESIAEKALPVEPSAPDSFAEAFKKAAHQDEAELLDKDGGKK